MLALAIMGGRNSRLGRALGETMAVTMVIGNRPEIAKSLFRARIHHGECIARVQ